LAILFSSLILTSVILATVAGGFLNSRPARSLVLRVDDIQDYAFREAQLFLLNYAAGNHLELSLSVISGMFGEDIELLKAVQVAVGSGSEVSVHGWRH